MVSLSKLVREAADHTSWRMEVERVASALGIQDPEQIETAWQAISEPIDALQVLAFDYRHHSDQFLQVLKQWYVDQRSHWCIRNDDLASGSSESEMGEPVENLIHAAHTKLIGRIEACYEVYQSEIVRAKALQHFVAPSLSAADAKHAADVVAYLRKAQHKVKILQRHSAQASFEYDVFRTVIEELVRHFESMTPTEWTSEEDCAA